MAKENNRSSYFGDVVKKFLAHRLAMIGTIVLILEVLAVVLLPSIMKLDPYSMDYMAFGGAPSAEHLLGCDDVGRDLFARLIFGGRVSLMVGICSALISLAIGVPLGLFAGYFRGAVETVIMRCADIFMSFPNMILILVLASVLGQSLTTVTLVIGFLGWTEFARLIYASVLSVREKDYVESAKAIGTALISVLLAILIFRSTAVFPLIIYVIVGLVSFGGVWAFYTIKPITDRPNISISDFMKQRKDFSKRPKVYYKKPKERV